MAIAIQVRHAITLAFMISSAAPSVALEPWALGPRFDRGRASDRYVLDLFSEANNSRDPEFLLAFAMAIENQNMGCVAVLGDVVERRCDGTSEVTGEDLEEARREIAFRYYLKGAEVGSAQAAFIIGERLSEKRYPADFIAKFPGATARPFRIWIELARDRGWLAASEYLVSLDARTAREKIESDAEAGRIKVAETTNPNCSKLRFSGIAVGMTAINLTIAHQQPNLDRHIAQYPLVCFQSAFSQTYACRGITHFSDQPGFLLSWTKDWLQIVTPVDLVGGAQDAIVYVDRSSARCVDRVIPAALTSDNLTRFHAQRIEAYRRGQIFFQSMGH